MVIECEVRIICIISLAVNNNMIESSKNEQLKVAKDQIQDIQAGVQVLSLLL